MVTQVHVADCALIQEFHLEQHGWGKLTLRLLWGDLWEYNVCLDTWRQEKGNV